MNYSLPHEIDTLSTNMKSRVGLSSKSTIYFDKINYCLNVVSIISGIIHSIHHLFHQILNQT